MLELRPDVTGVEQAPQAVSQNCVHAPAVQYFTNGASTMWRKGREMALSRDQSVADRSRALRTGISRCDGVSRTCQLSTFIEISSRPMSTVNGKQILREIVDMWRRKSLLSQ